MIASQRSEILRFGIFELDVSAGELRKNGVRVKLQQQPFRVLICLLEKSGNVVPREDLIQRLWPNGTVVEYEHSLGTAVNKIRQALDDSADNPRFVETLPRRGYRFLLPVERIARPTDERPQPFAPPLAPQPGGTISHYRIIEKIGEGGIGVVYKAEDTRLERPVALKFLAAHTLESGEHKARFLREAKAAARLDHPNVCTIHEIGEVDGQTFMAMAYLEGRTLKDRIRERPLKLSEALDVAIQTAQGLQAAHEKGIVHRDIKSANLMLLPQGRVKIMDFGLAQLANRSRLTQAAAFLGTPAYMSPEQAQRQPTDRRTDIWSLGVVLYEMLTGRVPFESDRETAALHAIIHDDPEPITALRAGVPVQLDAIVGKTLAKDPQERYQNAEDLIVDLRGFQKRLEAGKSTVRKAQAAGQTAVAQPSVAQVEPRERRKQTLLLGAAGVIVALALAFAFFPSPLTEAPLRRFILPTNGIPTRPSISPNGHHVAYLTKPMTSGGVLWVQDLDEDQPRAIFGPDRLIPFQPAWSPDSQFIVFRLGSDLKKISVAGGPALTVCESPVSAFAWTPDGKSIVFSDGTQLYRVPSRGGSPEPWGELQLGRGWPLQLALFRVEDGSDKLLYAEGRDPRDTETEIFAVDRASGQHEKLAAGRGPAYAPSGHVLYDSIDPQGIWAVPFSVETMKASGDPFPVSENGESPSIALDGTLAYLEVPESSGLEQLVWRDREGNKLGTIGQPQQSRILYAALSPNGKRVAVSGQEDGAIDIWIHEVDRPVKTRVTKHEAREMSPTWSPTGEQIAFSSGRTGQRDLYLKSADGTGEAKPLLSTPDAAEYVVDWSRDGEILLGHRMRRAKHGSQTGDIFYLKQTDDRSGYEERPFLQTSFSELLPQLSPDGCFLAYVSNESGRFEVYIQSFPQGGGKQRVSVDGGLAPRWRADGKELFYVENNDTLIAVPVSTSPSLTLAAPERLFSSPGLFGFLHYDVTPDGKKFVLPEKLEAEAARPPAIRIVQNWFAEFKGRQDN